MPTIPDDLQAAVGGTEESESEREGGPKKLFSVGQLETEEETEDDNHHRYAQCGKQEVILNRQKSYN